MTYPWWPHAAGHELPHAPRGAPEYLTIMDSNILPLIDVSQTDSNQTIVQKGDLSPLLKLELHSLVSTSQA